jgi:hypothetical protein
MAGWLRSRSVRTTFLLGLVLASATAVTACLGPLIPGECSDEERAAFESIGHDGAVEPVPEHDALGGCRATFESADDPQDVVDHYARALEADGWVVERTSEGPITDESGNRFGTIFDLAAVKGTMAAELTGALYDGEPSRWSVLVRRVAQRSP